MADDLSNVAVAGISLLGTLAGSGGGLIMTNKLIAYRLARLEETVRERGTFVERVYALEKDKAVVNEQIREIGHRLDVLEHERSKKA